jgi:superfamily I DNA/RNA helicase
MTISKSKGLTADTSIILGVEEPIIPFLLRGKLDEERRLLYVALTRAKNICIATFVQQRYGQLARIGGGKEGAARSRSRLVEQLSFSSPENGMAFVEAELESVQAAMRL